MNSEKKEKYEQAIVAYKKLVENVEVLAELLCEKMPDLPMEGKIASYNLNNIRNQIQKFHTNQDLNKKEDDILNIDLYTPGKNDEVRFFYCKYFKKNIIKKIPN